MLNRVVNIISVDPQHTLEVTRDSVRSRRVLAIWFHVTFGTNDVIQNDVIGPKSYMKPCSEKSLDKNIPTL